MKTVKNYYIYIFISTFTRNIIDIYSIIYIYKLGFMIPDIISMYAIIFFLGYFISNLTIRIGNQIGYKYLLILSQIFTCLTFYIFNNFPNLYLISISISLSMFTYHPIRHYYGIKLLREKKEIGNSLILTYIASLLSSFIVISNMKLSYLIIISIISILPAIFITKNKPVKIISPKRISKSKINFFIFDQFKYLFILLEPLYLYLISSNISYVGIFNIILTIASILTIYILVNKINLNYWYKYLNIIFTLVLLIKINLHNEILLLIIAFLEGIGIKTNELVSTMNFYHNHELNEGYIVYSEKVFCITRSLILSIFYFLSLDLKVCLYILLIGIFILSFMYQEKKNTN